MILPLLCAVFGAFALAVEVLNFVAPEFFAGLHRDTALKESVKKTQAEVAESEKRVQALRKTLRDLHTELNRAVTGLEKMDEQFAERRKVDPVLVYAIKTSTKAPRRFRATLAKTLSSDAEESQSLIWGAPAFVEVDALTAEDARAAALRQFPEPHGYSVGAFQETARPAEAAA